jgi:hypothetical protein
MIIARELARLIEDSFSYTFGSNLFIDNVPIGVTNALYIDHLGGISNNYLPTGIAVLDIISRNVSAETAIDNLNEIKNHFVRMYSTETSNAYIYSILLVSDIENVGRDLESMAEYKITVEVNHRDKLLIS